MPKKAKEVTAVQIPRFGPGLHPVGGVAGLQLQVAPSGARSWVLRVMVGGRRREMGLGGWPDVPLAEARVRARAAREKIESGIDPVDERRAARAGLRNVRTFRECAELLIEAKKPGWKNAKHGAQWEATLENYVFPVLGKMPVGTVTESDVLRVLTPIWTTKTETATRVRQRIESVLDWAKAAKLRTGENPARWAGNLEHMLAAPTKVAKKRNHPALPYSELHAFVSELRKRGSISARALEFTILTAARTGEVLEMPWSEVDMDAGVWIVPPERMKAGREHRVPLSETALGLLRNLPRISENELVFPSYKGGMSDAALGKLIKDMHKASVAAGDAGWLDPRQGRIVTTHGFRSTFKDWALETTAYPGEMSEMALAHTVSDKTEAAYRRGDLFDKRRRMMADWANYIDTPPAKGDNVVPIRKPA